MNIILRWLAAPFYLTYLFIRWLIRYGSNWSDSPIIPLTPSDIPPPPEHDQAKRAAVIKQGFHPTKIPEDLDAIIIGSGIGGLSTGVLLARSGWKVLVLEQHDQAGGCCHTFVERGYEFDVGIHYVGDVGRKTELFRILCDQLTRGRVAWAPMDREYETVILGDPANQAKLRKYPLVAGKQLLKQSLISHFPEETEQINGYFAKVQSVVKCKPWLALSKLLPHSLLTWWNEMGILTRITSLFNHSRRTITEVLDCLGCSDELKAVLQYFFMNTGILPDEAPWLIQGIMTNHYRNGGFYPVGGPSEFALQMIPEIEAAGGRVLVRANVRNILFEENRAVGVSLGKGTGTYEIRAKAIISDAGIANTFTNLIPRPLAEGSRYFKHAEAIGQGTAFLTLFVGMDCSNEELELKGANYWAFTSNDYCQQIREYLNGTLEDAIAGPVPLLFISFPSAKDPTWNDRYPGKSTCAVITMVNGAWFEPFKNGKVKHRGDEYEGLKTDFGRTIWEQTCRLFPHLAGKEDVFEVGTPLTNNHYIQSLQGEIYGMHHTTDRFSPEAMIDLRAETDLPGLYLTGQDVFMCGFAGAAFSGVLCATTLLNRSLLVDMYRIMFREWKRIKQSGGRENDGQ